MIKNGGEILKKEKEHTPASEAPHNITTIILNYTFFGDKCFEDTEYEESPSAGWQFVKYCMRG